MINRLMRISGILTVAALFMAVINILEADVIWSLLWSTLFIVSYVLDHIRPTSPKLTLGNVLFYPLVSDVTLIIIAFMIILLHMLDYTLLPLVGGVAAIIISELAVRLMPEDKEDEK